MTFEPAPKGVKPYRDYLDRDYEKEKDPMCAAVSGTLAKLNLVGNPDESGRFTPTFGMNLWSHLREDPQIILIRDKVNEVVEKRVLDTFIHKEGLGNINEGAF